MINPTSKQIDAAFSALRHAIDQTGYGHWVTDNTVNGLATAVSVAVLNAEPPLAAPKSAILRTGTK